MKGRDWFRIQISKAKIWGKEKLPQTLPIYTKY